MVSTPSAAALRAANAIHADGWIRGDVAFIAEQVATFIDSEFAGLVEAAKAKSGHVIDDQGVERLVLPTSFGSGQFHTTHDGAIIPDLGSPVWSWEVSDGNRFTGRAIRMKYSTYLEWKDRDRPIYKHAPDGWWRCYSSHEAAELAKIGGAA